MKFVRITVNDIELKYTRNDMSLVWNYIGDLRVKGDLYYNEAKYAWYECIADHGRPVGIVCLTENQHLPRSVHLSVLEVFYHCRGEGMGGQIMTGLEDIARQMKYRTITLQPISKEIESYYARFGYKVRNIDHIRIMRKYI